LNRPSKGRSRPDAAVCHPTQADDFRPDAGSVLEHTTSQDGRSGTVTAAGEGRPKGGHALAILPGLTHYNLATSPLFAAATLDFLDEQPS
jgi:hypothetical protein